MLELGEELLDRVARENARGDCIVVEVRADDTVESLHERIKAVEHRLLPEVVKELCAR